MTKTMCGTAAVLMLGVAIVLADQSGRTDAVQGGLNSRIGPPNPQRYKSIRDAKDWRNPYLIIRAEGIEIVAEGMPSGRQTVVSSELERALIGLPLGAWPYGRVVVVQDIGILAAGSNEQPIDDNRRATLAILKTLKVTVERRPS